MSEIYCNCPYCNKEITVEIEGCNTYDKYEDYCSNCKKVFDYRVEFSAEVYPEKKIGEIEQ